MNLEKYTRIIVNKEGRISITNSNYVLQPGEIFLKGVLSIDIFETLDRIMTTTLELILEKIDIKDSDCAMYTKINGINYKLVEEKI